MRSTVGDASRIAHIPASTIRRWIAEGSLPSTLEKGIHWVDVGQVCDYRDGRSRKKVAERLRRLTK